MEEFERHIEHAEERRSPFPAEWGYPPADIEERLAWVREHARHGLQNAIAQRRADPAVVIAIVALKRQLALMRRGPI
jgi:hypothetical protein